MDTASIFWNILIFQNLFTLSGGQIEYIDAYQILSESLNTTNIYLSDTEYRLMNRESAGAAVKLFSTLTPLPAALNTYDCDDFALQLYASVKLIYPDASLGVMWATRNNFTTTHALNVFIDNNRKVWYLEPQTGEIYSPEIYEPYLIIM